VGRKEGKKRGKEKRKRLRTSHNLITQDRHQGFQFFITCRKTEKANNVNHYVKLGKKSRESSKRYMVSPRVITKAIIIIYVTVALPPDLVVDMFT